MKLELLDAYNVRARLSVSILLLAPIAITLFFLFDEIRSFATSSIIIFVLLALTNYVPVFERTFGRGDTPRTNYAAELLHVDNETISAEVKQRYYSKLVELDKSFSCFEKPENSRTFESACESAVVYLRNRTRDNHLVQEENINFGFCKNLLACKIAGLSISASSCLFTALYSYMQVKTVSDISVYNRLAFATNFMLFLFWLLCATKRAMDRAGLAYAKTLISAIDTLN